MFSRRDMLAATAVGGVVTAATMTTANATPVKSDIAFGNPNDPPQGAINAKNPRSISDPGPQNPAIRDQFPGAFSPPATDVGCTSDAHRFAVCVSIRSEFPKAQFSGSRPGAYLIPNYLYQNNPWPHEFSCRHLYRQPR
jgi:hypothetical protein